MGDVLGANPTYEDCVAALASDDYRRRYRALALLAASVDPRALDHVLAVLTTVSDDPDDARAVETFAAFAAWLLGQTKNPRALAPMLAHLDVETRPPVFIALLISVGAVGGDDAVEPLFNISHSGNAQHVQAAVTGLQTIGTERAIAALAALRRLKRQYVQFAANALGQLDHPHADAALWETARTTDNETLREAALDYLDWRHSARRGFFG